MQLLSEYSLITLDCLPEAYIRLDGKFRCAFVNLAAQLLLGKPREKLLGNRLWDLYPGNAAKPLEDGFRRTIADGLPFTANIYERPRKRHYAITAVPDQGNGLLVRLSDITDRPNGQATILSRLNRIARNLPGFVYQTCVSDDGEWGVSFADKRAAEMFGIDPEPLKTAFKRFAACIAPEDQGRFMASIRESTRSKKDWEFQGRFITPGGESKYIQGLARARQIGNRTVYDGIILDITHLKHTEQALRDSEELYRQVFEVESDALLLVDRASGQILAANAAAMDLYGYSRQELLSVSRHNLSMGPSDSARTIKDMESFISLRQHRKKDGTLFPAEVSGRYFELRGRSVCVYAVRDITQRTAIEESLRKSEEKFSKAFHSNPAATLIADISNQFYLDVNETFERITGYQRDEIVGRTWQQVRLFAKSEERDKFLSQLVKEGSVRNFDFLFRKKSGDVGTGLLSAELIEIAGDQCVISATIDITERLLLETQLRQAHKLEGLGRLAGGVAHDFNNLLTVINGYSEFILKRLSVGDPLYPPAQEINKAGERAASLTRQLLAFSRKQVIKPRRLDLNVIVNEAQQMFQRLIGEDIELLISLEPLLGPIMADPDQIQLVILNLVVNARDAMTAGGKLEITTKNVDLDESSIGAHPNAVPGRYVVMTVTDTGIGMSQETMQCIFDPFFTTKAEGKGTGLGLAMVYGIVRQSGGWIEVSSKVGEGASFGIYLPRIDTSPGQNQPESPIPTKRYGNETVLVVEDQEEVRRLTRTILEADGYHVIEAASGEEALSIEKNYPGEIDVLLTDVILPRMNGKVLSERLRILRPKLKLVFTSGYPADVISPRGLVEPDVAFLQKPFSRDSLAAKVRGVLEGPPPTQ
jgi:PAS domain S-box-containing protein